MVFIEGNDVIQQLAAAAANPALGDAVLPGASEGSLNRTDTQGANRDWDFPSVLGIAIEDQESRSRLKWKRLPQLLDDPQTRRMLGDVEMQNATATVADDEKAVKHAESNRRNGTVKKSIAAMASL